MRHLRCEIRGIGLVVLLALNLPGCCKPHTPERISGSFSTNAIFNPAGSQVALADFDRTDWPVAYIDGSREEVVYQQQFTDIQGLGYDQEDGYLIRRFDSQRLGRSRR